MPAGLPRPGVAPAASQGGASGGCTAAPRPGAPWREPTSSAAGAGELLWHVRAGQWGRGHAWASFKPGTPGAAVEEAHWAGALLAAANLSLCDSDVCYEYEGPPLPRIAEGGQQGPEIRHRRQPYLLERLLALHTPAPPPAAAPAAGAAPAQPPAGPEAAYSYTWLAEEVLFVFMDAWADVMDLKEWRRLLDINPSLPFLPLLATLAKKLLVSGQELPASAACARSGCCPVADVHAADSQPAGKSCRKLQRTPQGTPPAGCPSSQSLADLPFCHTTPFCRLTSSGGALAGSSLSSPPAFRLHWGPWQRAPPRALRWRLRPRHPRPGTAAAGRWPAWRWRPAATSWIACCRVALWSATTLWSSCQLPA